MPNQNQRTASVPDINVRAEIIALVLAVVVTTMTIPAQAQAFQVIHTFTGGADGANPAGAGITLDQAGNLYGATLDGGLAESDCYTGSCGTVFKISHRGSGWTFNTLYKFTGGGDGALPDTPVTFAPNGVLYGTTYYGGAACSYEYGCGTVFSLQPSPTACKSALCPWTENVLYRFTGGSGSDPTYGALSFDAGGNLYGTTSGGGAHGQGNVYELTPSSGGWAQQALYSFTGNLDGGSPRGSVIFDPIGNLYGTTSDGGYYSGGTVFELSPSGQGWSLQVLHAIEPQTDGYLPYGNLFLDPSGNLWGTDNAGGPGAGGTAFKLTPSNGSWDFSVLYPFNGNPFSGPTGNLVMDPQGNLYGARVGAGTHACGSVFKLTPNGSGWTETVLYSFTCGSDGEEPYGQIARDADGNLYGTTWVGGMTGGVCGTGGCGVVWEITP
ncbi:MAG: choice-of-anchor tandem repeat GloVer-containing protein [Candidatus Korobacteraceae bacterium]